MRNMRYTQQVEEMKNKRKARILTTQEIIALTLVIAAFAYIIFGLINTDEAAYYEMEYSEQQPESYDNYNAERDEEPQPHYEMYYETP